MKQLNTKQIFGFMCMYQSLIQRTHLLEKLSIHIYMYTYLHVYFNNIYTNNQSDPANNSSIML